MADPLTGRLLGGTYEVEEKLGAGGMGVVYAARHVRTGRGYAVKVLLPEAAERPAALARFRREAEAVSALGHASIVVVHDFDQTDDGLAYIVMNRLEGEDLAARLHRQGVLTFEESRRIVRELAGALTAAHQVGVLHRDIKPSNIFLATTPGAPERAVLLDFGLVKMIGDDASKLTATGLTLGTPAYMSPEQARGADVDERTDVYSLAATLFEMLSGQAPFVAPHPTALIARLLADPPPLVSTVARTAIPAELDALLFAGLAKAPIERPSSVRALSAALDAMGPQVSGDAIAAASATLPETRAMMRPAQVTPATRQFDGTPPTHAARATPPAHATGSSRTPFVIGGSIVFAAGMLGAALLLPSLLVTEDVATEEIEPGQIAQAPDTPTDVAGPAPGQLGLEAQDVLPSVEVDAEVAEPDAAAEDAAAEEQAQEEAAPTEMVSTMARRRRRPRMTEETAESSEQDLAAPVSMDAFRAKLPPQDQSEYDTVAAAVARMEVRDWAGCMRIARSGPRRFRTLSTWFNCASRAGNRAQMEAACAASERSFPRHGWSATCRQIIDVTP